jgi:hypothetical protein
VEGIYLMLSNRESIIDIALENSIRKVQENQEGM